MSKCSRVMNMSTSSTRPPSCMYCLGELSPMEGTPANMLFPSERDSASSRSRPPPRARFLGDERGYGYFRMLSVRSDMTHAERYVYMKRIESLENWRFYLHQFHFNTNKTYLNFLSALHPFYFPIYEHISTQPNFTDLSSG